MDQSGDQLRFSIVVPAYNEAAYLGRALQALQDQDYNGNYEIIVVDNNSTDDTVAVAARYGVRIVSEPQQGVCAARQRGVEHAQGEIIISTDADTMQPRDWLRTIDACFAPSEQVVAVAGPCRYENHLALRFGCRDLRIDRIRVLCECNQHRGAPQSVSWL